MSLKESLREKIPLYKWSIAGSQPPTGIVPVVSIYSCIDLFTNFAMFYYQRPLPLYRLFTRLTELPNTFIFYLTQVFAENHVQSSGCTKIPCFIIFFKNRIVFSLLHPINIKYQWKSSSGIAFVCKKVTRQVPVKNLSTKCQIQFL